MIQEISNCKLRFISYFLIYGLAIERHKNVAESNWLNVLLEK
jgi:hypothetical protein